ncbi:MAG: winged helix-turn-helix transcriptional regulator [Rhodanobacter sp.]
MSAKNKLEQIIFDERYPARRILAVLSNKWTPIVIYCLSSGVRRFGEMERALPGISRKMLTQVLRQLERDGLVKRAVHPVVPPMVEYTLTALGRSLHEPIAALCLWASQNRRVLEIIERNRSLKAKI